MAGPELLLTAVQSWIILVIDPYTLHSFLIVTSAVLRLVKDALCVGRYLVLLTKFGLLSSPTNNQTLRGPNTWLLLVIFHKQLTLTFPILLGLLMSATHSYRLFLFIWEVSLLDVRLREILLVDRDLSDVFDLYILLPFTALAKLGSFGKAEELPWLIWLRWAGPRSILAHVTDMDIEMYGFLPLRASFVRCTDIGLLHFALGWDLAFWNLIVSFAGKLWQRVWELDDGQNLGGR